MIERDVAAIVQHVVKAFGGRLPHQSCSANVREIEGLMVARIPEWRDAPDEVKAYLEAKLLPVVEAHLAAQNSTWCA
jgi:hypothetical protein